MSINQKIAWGILGAGDVAEIKSGPAFQKAENSELVAVMRRNAEKAEDFANRHGVPKWYDNADALINDTEINAVYIATPPKYHRQYAIKALNACKFVYLEKPMALNLEASKEIAAVCEKVNGKLCVAHYRRELDAFQFVEKSIKENVIGDIRFAKITIRQPVEAPLVAKTDENWRLDPAVSGGGLFHDLSPHQIDLMIKWFGAPKEISGVSKNNSGKNLSDDLVIGQFTCSKNILVQGIWCFSVAESQAEDNCTIYGSDGIISFSFYGDAVTWKNGDGNFEKQFENPANIQLPMIQEAVNYFRGQRKNPCSGEDAIKVMEVIDQFTRK